ncbi:helicase [Candidatus Arthromitus sp. SFB-rat-Yit]|uniref:helicase n=1 Tax=Candidatus Arthromitus sp. SFB-rat-Yit TaxID=1041504 RepID=UPI000227A461|nr:helicase [Candidatus Arthromitus sp. SFB-rat-Yit]BAK80932.1 superfamily I DNA and RNA helicase and helicase subunits-like protein [Candidatus Arthromitus sp. SFB-rat-Yit]
MSDSLKRYQDVSINFSLDNKTIYLDNIYNEDFLDLYVLKSYNEDIYSNFINFIFSDSIEVLKIIEDPLTWQSDKLFKIKEEVNKIKKDKLSKFEESHDFPNIKDYEIFLDNFYKGNVSKNLDLVNIQYSNMNNVSLNLDKLCKGNKRSDLYIGYPFIEGYIDNVGFVRMPFFLIPVEVFSENNEWFIRKMLKRKIKINRYLIIIFQRILKRKNLEIKLDYDFNRDFKKDVLKVSLDFLKSLDIGFHNNDVILDNKFDEFLGMIRNLGSDKSDLDIKNYLVLGRFDVIGNKYEDYESLIYTDMSKTLVGRLISNDCDNKDNYKEDIYKEIYVKDKLDFDQKKSICLSDDSYITLINSNLDIGKDTTVTNFIFDKICKNKSLLVVSKNKEYLKKLYNEFSSTKPIIMDLFQSNFYQKFYRSFDRMLNFKKNSDITREFNEILDGINKNYRFIEDSNEIYNKIENFGLSLKDMYELTMNLGDNDIDKVSFSKFKLNNPVSGCTFDEIIGAIDKIKDENLIDIFISHKEYLNKHKILNSIREDFNFDDVNLYLGRLKSLREKYDKLSLDIDQNKCSESVVELFKENSFTKNEIIDKCFKCNEHYIESDKYDNSDVSEFWIKSLWFGKNNKKSTEVNKRALIDTEMYYEAVKKIDFDISFIKDIVKHDKFEFIRERVFSFNDITYFLDNLIEMMDSFHEFIEYSYKIKNFTTLVNDILEYVYNNSISEKMMKDNLDKILKFSIFVNISRRHSKHGDALENYKMVDRYFNNLIELFDKRASVLEKFILNNVMSEAKESLIGTDDKINKNDFSNISKYLIKDFINTFNKECLKLFPCFLVDYEEVFSRIPLIEGLFDYVVFVDGHNYFLEEIIPIVYRGKKMVIFGSDNQIDCSSRSYNIISRDVIEVSNNVFKFLGDKFNRVDLKYTYTSGNEIFRDISNCLFKTKDIISLPKDRKYSYMDNPFMIFTIGNKDIENINEYEAKFVVDLLFKHLKVKEYEESIGIVTINRNHADLIKNVIKDRLKLDEEFNFLYNKECKKYKSNDGIYITSISEISYKKIDIVIFSLGGERNLENEIEIKFNDIENQNCRNKLNMFLMMTQCEMDIVTSLSISDIENKEYFNENINVLKKYLNYANEIYSGNMIKVMDELNYGEKFDNKSTKILDIIHDKLVDRGLIVEKNFGTQFYKFDFAIYDKDLKKYILFVEFESSIIQKFKDKPERYVDCFIYFDKLGYNVLKIWSRDLWSDIDFQVENIIYNYFLVRDKLLKLRSKNILVENLINKHTILSKFVDIIENRRIELICENSGNKSLIKR